MQILIALAVFGVLGISSLVAVAVKQTGGSHDDHASAMTVGMTLGMVSGLTTGIVAGLLMPDDMLVPTAVGSVSGVLAGWVGGRFGGLAATLEGVMSGIMGGTMGAMMGGMMPTRGTPLLVSALVLTVGAGVASLALLRPKGHPGHHVAWLSQRTILASAMVALLGGGGAWFASGPLVHRMPVPDDHRHISPVEVTVRATEFGFSPSVVEVPLGSPIRLHLVNEGSQEHDLTIPALEYRLSARRDRRAEPPGLHLFAASGRTETLEIIPLRAGQYKAFCSVAGHKEQGMAFTLRIVAPPEDNLSR